MVKFKQLSFFLKRKTTKQSKSNKKSTYVLTWTAATYFIKCLWQNYKDWGTCLIFNLFSDCIVQQLYLYFTDVHVRFLMRRLNLEEMKNNTYERRVFNVLINAMTCKKTCSFITYIWLCTARIWINAVLDICLSSHTGIGFFFFSKGIDISATVRTGKYRDICMSDFKCFKNFFGWQWMMAACLWNQCWPFL